MHNRASPSPPSAPAEFLVVIGSSPMHYVRNRADTSADYVILEGNAHTKLRAPSQVSLDFRLRLTVQGGAAYSTLQNMLSRNLSSSSSPYNNPTKCPSLGELPQLTNKSSLHGIDQPCRHSDLDAAELYFSVPLTTTYSLRTFMTVSY